MHNRSLKKSALYKFFAFIYFTHENEPKPIRRSALFWEIFDFGGLVDVRMFGLSAGMRLSDADFR
jgi:hypothetical protein